MPIPDVFIIGAPKCGTTSLASWLGQHPGIFMCVPKEPNYYAPELIEHPAVKAKADYKRLFSGARPGQQTAEASTCYLRSHHAVKRILADNPDAKFIVCLRNPVDMAPSAHAQLLKGGRITQRDFNIAWRLQPKLPTPVGTETMLDMCRLGEQVERLLMTAPRDQVFFVLLDDLRSSPLTCYKNILTFIGVAYDGRTEFKSLNQRRYPRSISVAALLSAAWKLKRVIGISRSFSVGNTVAKFNNRRAKTANADMTADTRRLINETFRSDIKKLERLTGKDLSAWQGWKPSSSSSGQ